MPGEKANRSNLETRTGARTNMRSILSEAFEWLDRAEQAREVAGQLTDPSARKTVLELADSLDRLARAAATPAAKEKGVGQERLGKHLMISQQNSK